MRALAQFASMEAGEILRPTQQMKIPSLIVLVLLTGLGIYALRFCSERFMMLRRSKSMTPYLYGVGGILSLALITLAVLGAVLVLIGPLH